MPTIFTHPAVAVGLSPVFDFKTKTKQVLIVAALLTILPDIDVLGFKLGIPYSHLFGHRGFTHSLFFAVFTSMVVAWFISRRSELSFAPVWGYFSICMASHGILDAFTNGGYGIAFFSPFSNERYFFGVHPIEVSTLSIQRFFAEQGYVVILSELKWVWLPAMVFFLIIILIKNIRKIKVVN